MNGETRLLPNNINRDSCCLGSFVLDRTCPHVCSCLIEIEKSNLYFFSWHVPYRTYPNKKKITKKKTFLFNAYLWFFKDNAVLFHCHDVLEKNSGHLLSSPSYWINWMSQKTRYFNLFCYINRSWDLRKEI